MPKALERRVVNAISVLKDELPPKTIAILTIERIMKPPRRVIIRFVAQEGGRTDMVEKECPTAKIELESRIGVMAELAAELLGRWPAGSGPDTVGLMTDGRCVVFNPGRPEANGMEWYDHHLEGKSFAAIAAGELENPLGLNWNRKG